MQLIDAEVPGILAISRSMVIFYPLQLVPRPCPLLSADNAALGASTRLSFECEISSLNMAPRNDRDLRVIGALILKTRHISIFCLTFCRSSVVVTDVLTPVVPELQMLHRWPVPGCGVMRSVAWIPSIEHDESSTPVLVTPSESGHIKYVID